MPAAKLQALPAVTVEIGRTKPSGTQYPSFTGALRWTLVTTAGPLNGPGKQTFLRKPRSRAGATWWQ